MIIEYIALGLYILAVTLPFIHIINAVKVEKKCPIRNHNKKITEKSFSILIPCYNEEKILETTIKGILQLNYKNYEVIFINDGSSDNTINKLNEILESSIKENILYTEHIPTKKINNLFKSNKYPNFYVIDKQNGGKADALNSGINFSNKDLIVTLDADSILDKNSLKIVNEHFQDPLLIAAGGTVKILQSRDSLNQMKTTLKRPFIVRIQILEYLNGFYIYKRSLAKFQSLAIISGAFGIFNKQILHKINGFRETVGEDIDITIRIQKLILASPEYKISHIPEALCYTECPEAWQDLGKQRVRWQIAFIDALTQHWRFFIKNSFKTPLSFFVIIDAFLIGILSVFTTYIAMFLLIFKYGLQVDFLIKLILLYFTITLVTHISYSLTGVRIARKYGMDFTNKFDLIKNILIDTIVFRFISTFFIIWGSIKFFISRNKWNKVERTGRTYFEKTEDVRSGSAQES